ncbi:MAG: PLP-dependent transferase [Planctomycetes bacterium]|nr:PLP-dependent transferase [Planctomycetota bacterium]
MRFETRCVHVGVQKDSQYRSVMTPIYATSTFIWDDAQTHRGFDYTRSGNPTRRALEESIASLEGGIDCRATGSGVAAIAAVMHLFQPGDHIVSANDIYGGTFRLFYNVFAKRGLRFSFVPLTDPDNLRRALTPETKCVWVETPSNPLMNITDLSAVCEIAHEAGVKVVADNTFLSPYFQRPFEHGVDIVVHSTTKYLNGHSDVVGGCVVTRHPDDAERIDYITNALGVTCSPYDAWLVLRGIKTLGLRMEAHQRSAMALAQMLAEHPKVERVYYPGLPDHPGHELAKRQQTGFGGMLSFDIKGGRAEAEKVLTRTRLFALAESLGGVESLIAYPETMSHASMTPEARREAGISEKTIRISAGIEHPDDLVEDLRQSLEG